MTTQRVYQDAFSPDEAMGVIVKGGFDPQVVEAFVQAYTEGEIVIDSEARQEPADSFLEASEEDGELSRAVGGA